MQTIPAESTAQKLLGAREVVRDVLQGVTVRRSCFHLAARTWAQQPELIHSGTAAVCFACMRWSAGCA